MTTHPRSSWSQGLQKMTRNAVEQVPVTPDGFIYFKHAALGAAYATVDDLIHYRMVLRSRSGESDATFTGVDELLEAGWAID